MSDIAIKTEQLQVIYPNGVQALRSTNLEIERGSFVVLLGSSGAGKSSLLRALNGLVPPGAGRVLATFESGQQNSWKNRPSDVGPSVAGIPLDISPSTRLRQHRSRTGMVFQQHHLIGRLTVLDNVLMGRLGHHHGWRALLPCTRAEKAMALRAIHRVGLLERALQRADQLSGGQQQRVGVARALVQSPQLLLADEPVASLDPATALDLLGLMHSICKSDGLTAVVSLHQVEYARQFADRIIGLHQGQVVFDDQPQQLTEAVVQRLYRVTAMPEALGSAETHSGNAIGAVLNDFVTA